MGQISRFFWLFFNIWSLALFLALSGLQVALFYFRHLETLQARTARPRVGCGSSLRACSALPTRGDRIYLMRDRIRQEFFWGWGNEANMVVSSLRSCFALLSSLSQTQQQKKKNCFSATLPAQRMGCTTRNTFLFFA